jgi:iron complex outermembrane receptor protein
MAKGILKQVSPCLLLWLFGLLWQTVSANDGNALTVNYYFEDLPVVLSATRLSQPLSDIPASMTVIDRDTISATGAITIPDILRLVPGMTVGFYSGSRASVSYHGLADEYARDMQVLVDGRSIYDPGFGGVSWPDMPIEVDEIARIEVVRGPNAAAYGSNSYAGIINIITEHPADQLGSSLKTLVGGGDTRRIYARHADARGGAAYRLSTSYQEYDGFAAIPDAEETAWFSFHGDYIINEYNELKVFFGLSDGLYEEGFNEIAQDVRQLDNRYHFQQINWQHQASPSNKIQFQLYHNCLEIDDDFRSPVLSEMIKIDSIWEDLDPDNQIPIDMRPDVFAQLLSAQAGLAVPYPDYATFLSELGMTDSPLAFSPLGFKSHRYDLELQQTLTWFDNLRLAWGLGMRQDNIKSIWLFHTDERLTRDQWRVFANLEWHLRRDLVANLGSMWEHFEKKQPFFSPRLALNYHLDRSNTLRLSASRAYRMPTLFEDFVYQVLFLDGPLDDLNNHRVAIENLDPQRIDSYELGYLGSFPARGLTLDVRLFRERLTDIIDDIRNLNIPNPDRGLTDPEALAVLYAFNQVVHRGAFSYTNSAEASIRGLELDLRFKPTTADLIQLGYAFLDADGNELRRIGGDAPTFTSDALGNTVPDHTFSLLLSHRFRHGFQLSSAYYFMDDIDWPGEGDEVPSYSRWDVRLAKDFRTSGMHAEISLLLQNLGEDNTDFFEDEDSGQINIWQTRAFLQAILKFH